VKENPTLLFNIDFVPQIKTPFFFFVSHISRDTSIVPMFTSEADDCLHSNDCGESRQEVLDMSRLASKCYEFIVFIETETQ